LQMALQSRSATVELIDYLRTYVATVEDEQMPFSPPGGIDDLFSG
jgi:hypothetical protein